MAITANSTRNRRHSSFPVIRSGDINQYRRNIPTYVIGERIGCNASCSDETHHIDLNVCNHGNVRMYIPLSQVTGPETTYAELPAGTWASILADYDKSKQKTTYTVQEHGQIE